MMVVVIGKCGTLLNILVWSTLCKTWRVTVFKKKKSGAGAWWLGMHECMYAHA
jgi:hypothetical protein